jgi:hypothetical protein
MDEAERWKTKGKETGKRIDVCIWRWRGEMFAGKRKIGRFLRPFPPVFSGPAASKIHGTTARFRVEVRVSAEGV